MTHAHHAQSRPEMVDSQGEVGYLEDPRREFMRAIERVAKEVVESFRDEVFLPLVETLDPPPPWEPRVLWDPINPRPVPPPDPRIMDLLEVQGRVDVWKAMWNLHRWDGRLSEARFNRLLSGILEQWEEGYFQPLKEKPMTSLEGARGCAFMEPIPWWYPKQNLDELPWSDRERLLIMGVPTEARFHWSREYCNDVAHRAMLEGSWVHQLELVTYKEMLETRKPKIELRTEADLTLPDPDVSTPLAQMEPPPTLPVYNPATDSGLGLPDWEERLNEIKKLYKERVDRAFEEAGFASRPQKVDIVNYERLVLQVIKGESINKIATDAGRDRRQISRALARTAERVGILRSDQDS